MLLSAQKDKLLGDWQGPYTTYKRIFDITYEYHAKKMKEEPHHPFEYVSQERVSNGCLPGSEGSNGRAEELATWSRKSESSEAEVDPCLSEQ